MRKLLTIILSCLMVLSLVACSKNSTDDKKTTDNGENKTKKVYNVANLINGNRGDKSFFDSAEAGLRELEKAGRITLKTIEMGATEADQPKWEEILNEVSSSGQYDLIVCGTYQMPDYLTKAAKTYPNQKYAIYDSAVDAPNVVTINYRQNDLGYLIGVLAAAVTTDTSIENINPEAVIGFVGGGDVPVINDFLYGYILGAQSVNKDIKVDTRYVTNYYDTAVAKELALAMIRDKKVDIIWGVAGLAGNGAAEAINEAGKGYFLGVDSDQELTLPENLAKKTLTSGLKNIGNSLIWLFDEWDNGKEYFGKTVLLGINEGGVGIVTDKNFKKLPANIQELINKAINDVKEGKVKIPTAIGEKNAEGSNKTPLQILRDKVQPK